MSIRKSSLKERKIQPHSLGKKGLVMVVHGKHIEYVPKGKMTMDEFVRNATCMSQGPEEEFEEWLKKNATEVKEQDESKKINALVNRLIEGG